MAKTNSGTTKSGNQEIGRRGQVCVLCHKWLVGQPVYKITPPNTSPFAGTEIVVCAACRVVNNLNLKP